MKNLYVLALSFAISIGAEAQNLPKPAERNRLSKEDVMSLKNRHSAVDRAQSFYMDHSVANYDDDFYMWRFNSNYVAADTALNFIGLSLNYIGGYTDPADPTASIVDSSFFGFTSTYPADIGIRIDSVFAYITHENNSGLYDKITMQVVKLTASGAPASTAGVATVLWEDVDSTNVSLSSGGNWLGTGAGVILTYTPYPDFIGASAGTKLGLVLKYNDPSKLDTFGLSAGYMMDPLDPTKALQSTIKTSYMRYPPFIPNVTRNSSVGYGTPAGSQGWYFAQNWAMWAYVAVGTDIDGFRENPAKGFRVIESYPNPTNDVTNVRYELGVTSDVSIVITDIVGNVVSQINQPNQLAGEHKVSLGTENLSNGIYTYTLTANKASVSKKFIVKH